MTWDKLKGIKNKKQIIIGLTVFLCVAVIGTVYYNNVISTAIHYKQAMAYYEDKDYSKAHEKFAALGDYKESKKLAKESQQKNTESKFNKATALMNNKDYDGAMAIFQELGNYNRSYEMVEMCKSLIEQRDLNKKADPVYSAYYTIAKSYFSTYGNPTVKKDPDNKKSYTVTGVNCLNLVDLNDDGTEELVIGYKNSTNDLGEYTVYTYHSNSAKKLMQNPYNHHSGYSAFELRKAEKGYCIYSGNTDEGKLLSFDGEKIDTDLSWENNADDSAASETYYIINGKKVSKKEYLAAAPDYKVNEISNGFVSPFETYQVISGNYTVYPCTHMTKSAAINLQSTSVQQQYSMLKESYDRTKTTESETKAATQKETAPETVTAKN